MPAMHRRSSLASSWSKYLKFGALQLMRMLRVYCMDCFESLYMLALSSLPLWLLAKDKMHPLSFDSILTLVSYLPSASWPLIYRIVRHLIFMSLSGWAATEFAY